MARVTVIGAAKSGIAVARLLRRKGEIVFVSDSASEETKSSEKVLLQNEGIEFEFGAHTDRSLECDYAVVSPGVPANISILKKLSTHVQVYSEIEIAARYMKGAVVSITGSNGKTTTTAWIGAICSASMRPTIVAGNIGTPLSDVVEKSTEETISVLEVSSFQAEGLEQFHPNIAVMTNLSPDHMDRYSTVNEYYGAKMRMIMNQTHEDILIYNRDDETLTEMVRNSRAQKYEFSMDKTPEVGAFIENGILTYRYGRHRENILEAQAVGIPGKHNLYNAMATTLATRVAGIDPDIIRDSLKNFKGVEHRLEFVREVQGVRFYNDSKATNVDSAKVALESFPKGIIWIAGGKHKGSSYSPLADAVRTRVKAVILIGEATELIEQDLGKGQLTIRAKTMEDAVLKARNKSQSGDVVLLSPACSSYDMFHNYEERGKAFKDCVARI